MSGPSSAATASRCVSGNKTILGLLPAVRARKQQSWREGNLVVGERDGPGVPYIAPERFGILAGCCNALSRGDSHTLQTRANGLVPTETTKGAHHQDTVASWPPCDRGRVIEEKSVEPEVGWLLSLQGGRGPIPAPRRRPLRPVAWRHNSLMRSGRPFCRARNGASPLNPPRRRHPLRTSNVGIGTTTTCST